MSHAMRRTGLAAAAGLVLVLTAACSSSTSTSTTSSSPASSASSSAGATGTLTVFGAGTLSTPFTAELAAFKQQNPGVTIHSQFGASARHGQGRHPARPARRRARRGGLLADPQAHVRPVQAARQLVRGVRVEPDHLRLHQPQQGRRPAHRVELVQDPGRARRAHRPVQPRRRPVGIPDPADAPARPGLLPRPGPVRGGAEELPGLQRRRDRDLAAGRPAVRPDRLPGHLPVRRAGRAPEVHRAARRDQPVRPGHGRRLRQGHHPRRARSAR